MSPCGVVGAAARGGHASEAPVPRRRSSPRWIARATRESDTCGGAERVAAVDTSKRASPASTTAPSEASEASDSGSPRRARGWVAGSRRRVAGSAGDAAQKTDGSPEKNEPDGVGWPTPSFAEAWFIKSPCCPAACEARRARPKSPSTMRVGTAPSGADPEAAEAILGLRESARGSVWSRESQSYYRLRHRRSHDSRATDLPPMGRPLVPPPGTTRTPPTARRAVLSSHTHITPE